MRAPVPDLSMLQWLDPRNWSGIAQAEQVPVAPQQLPPAFAKPFKDLAAELHASLAQAYFGPSLAGLPAGCLPAAFEADHRGTPDACADLLQIVSGRTVMGAVREARQVQLPGGQAATAPASLADQHQSCTPRGNGACVTRGAQATVHARFATSTGSDSNMWSAAEGGSAAERGDTAVANETQGAGQALTRAPCAARAADIDADACAKQSTACLHFSVGGDVQVSCFSAHEA